MLILHPGNMPKGPEQISCFSDVWTYYLVREMRKHVKELHVLQIPGFANDSADLANWFQKLDVRPYRAVVAMGLRYFSTVPVGIGQDLRKRLHPHGFLCQIHDGSRLDNDPVDITFNIKNESDRYPFDMGNNANRYVRHHASNAYIGWAADADINKPAQRQDQLGILVDHTNYGPNITDNTQAILADIKKFVQSSVWKPQWKSVSVRRFDSGRVVDVDFDDIDHITRYDRTTIPLTDICREHGAAHIFCVTHPESVGQVVLETAMAGALPVVPKNFVPRDRLETVRFIEYHEHLPWPVILQKINIASSREKAQQNTWEQVAKRLLSELAIRSRIRGLND